MEDSRENRIEAPQQIIMQASNAAFNRWVESLEEELQMFEHALRGESFKNLSEDGTPQWEQTDAPIMNQEAIRWLLSRIRLNLNKNTFMSNLDEERVYTISKDSATSLTSTLVKRWKEWEIVPEHIDEINVNLCNIYELALRRAMDEGERRRVMPLEQIHRTEYNDTTTGKSQGFFSSFFNRNKTQ